MATPLIGSAGEIKGGRHDGSRGTVVSSADSLFVIACYEHDGRIMTDIQGKVTKPQLAELLRQIVAQIEGRHR